VSPYRGIDKCDRCGRLLEKGRWLSGVCKACAQETSKTKTSSPDTAHQKGHAAGGRKGI